MAGSAVTLSDSNCDTSVPADTPNDLVLLRADMVRMPANAQMRQFCIFALRQWRMCLALLTEPQDGTYAPGSPALAAGCGWFEGYRRLVKVPIDAGSVRPSGV